MCKDCESFENENMDKVELREASALHFIELHHENGIDRFEGKEAADLLIDAMNVKSEETGKPVYGYFCVNYFMPDGVVAQVLKELKVIVQDGATTFISSLT